ncbi:uncharacterized protein LOC117314967 [Pecten maximus]|uniref:uncharacterized protein LOC117314967 n=1 Tax=Pecten maximus TaxID=6579 RepID=UPI001458A797|nr:uncharacterized protein LOC117314967 [Pecten maximus]
MILFEGVKCLIAVLLFKHISATTCGDIQSSVSTISRRLFTTESFYVETFPTFYQCAAACLHFSLCKSVTFDQERRKCYLNQHEYSSVAGVNVRNKMYYVNSTDIPQFLADVCRGHNCSVYDRCIPTSRKDHMCLPFPQRQWACHHWTDVEGAILDKDYHSEAVAETGL